VLYEKMLELYNRSRLAQYRRLFGRIKERPGSLSATEGYALDVIYLIDADQVPWAEKTYHDFANQYLFLQKLTSLSSITCTVDGQTLSVGVLCN